MCGFWAALAHVVAGAPGRRLDARLDGGGALASCGSLIIAPGRAASLVSRRIQRARWWMVVPHGSLDRLLEGGGRRLELLGARAIVLLRDLALRDGGDGAAALTLGDNELAARVAIVGRPARVRDLRAESSSAVHAACRIRKGGEGCRVVLSACALTRLSRVKSSDLRAREALGNEAHGHVAAIRAVRASGRHQEAPYATLRRQPARARMRATRQRVVRWWLVDTAHTCIAVHCDASRRRAPRAFACASPSDVARP
jgi:hypothetical protein